MKLGTLIKQSLLCFLALLIVGGSWSLLASYYKIIEAELTLQSGGILIGIYLTCVFVLQDLWGKYAPLKGATNIFSMSMLFVFSTLLAWIMAWSGITEWMVAFIRPLFVSESVPYYRLFFQRILVGILGVFILMPYFISLLSGFQLWFAVGYRSYQKMTAV